jgi:hypothetical protein
VPRSVLEAFEIHRETGINPWQEAIKNGDEEFSASLSSAGGIRQGPSWLSVYQMPYAI